MKIIESSLRDVWDFIQTIPEFHDPPSFEEVQKRCSGESHLALLAKDGEKSIGCKLGYSISEDIFYSWIGGILPKYRKQGIAQQLLNYQENWAWNRGYQTIRVKSMNRYPAMLIFLIKNHYQVVGIEGASVDELKILFEKQR